MPIWHALCVGNRIGELDTPCHDPCWATGAVAKPLIAEWLEEWQQVTAVSPKDEYLGT